MIGHQVKKWRIAKGMTQKQLAEGVCSLPFLYKLERGETDLSSTKIRLIAWKLQVPIEELFVIDVHPKLEKKKREANKKEVKPKEPPKSKVVEKKVNKIEREFAAYRGDEFLGIGTPAQLAELLGTKLETVLFYTSASAHKRYGDAGIVVIEIEDDDDE